MRRRDLEVAKSVVHMPSIVAGVVFVAIGVLYLAAAAFTVDVDAGLVVPVLLIGLGLAGLVRSRPRAATAGAAAVEVEDPIAAALREQARRELEDLDGTARAAAILRDAETRMGEDPR